ncbi:hypothetical protein CL632_01480 [bacterium]|jgi:hypothetical protein|nr:hypothetical protein [bacterium]MDP6571767.1 PEGA domain-containing protein [Patescibacteria group bacterium]MDP6756493.1 PEGA domain-containing protein [Patescibacteria group bacterium]|tara:strand:+ start:8688 stop:10115 length:1428 start_codon:yes stop_codon:yes gene_type:complete
MTLKTRRILYLSFIVIFFVVAPPLVLYTAGFRYDFKYNRVVETGSLVAKTYPENASIFLNGEQIPESTPTILNTILPGKINLLLELEGYHSWEKEIEIKPRITTFEERVKLFSESDPIQVLDKKIHKYWWNNSFDKLAYTTVDNELRLFNTLNQKDTLIANLSKKPLEQFSWSPHSDQILIARKDGIETEYVVVDANAFERIINISQIAASDIKDLQWDPINKSAIYALTSKNTLIRLNFLLRTQRTIYREPILEYLALDNRIIFLSNNSADDMILSWIETSDPSVIHLIPEITPILGDKIIKSSKKKIALKNSRTLQLTIIDPGIKPPLRKDSVLIIPNVKEILWSQNGEMISYSDGSGIYVYSFTTPISIIPQNPESKLITRYSKPISSISLTDDILHVFYTVGNELRVSELGSSSDPRSTTLLDNSSGIRDIQFIGRYDALTFVDASDNLNILQLSLKDIGFFPFGNQEISL